jgi:transcriptional regulator with XRE-family HTH domain
VIGPGQRLRELREQLGLTLRDVEQSSARIGDRLKNEEYAIPLSRLSDIETKAVVPSVYRMYSLAAIYRIEFLDLIGWYGIDLARLPTEAPGAEPRRTHRSELAATAQIEVPLKMDPSFDLRRTSNLGRMIEKWGLVPLAHLKSLSENGFTYGYIGSEDYTMYPLLLPGCFIQVDESKDHVVNEGAWRSEYERPIYFVETREGHICCWCSVKGDCIILQPHPLSPVPVRMMRYRQEADVVGQVVGIAMRLDQLSAPVPLPGNKEQAKLN